MPTPVVVLAASARALAECTLRSGWQVHAVDAFGDVDTRAASRRWQHLPLDRFCDPQQVLEAIAAVVGLDSSSALLLGGGFDGHPQVIAALAERYRLLGNGPSVWQAARDDAVFDRLGIPAPEWRREAPESMAGWLLKDRARAAGYGVWPACATHPVRQPLWQRRVRGWPGSLVFVAHAGGVVPVGFNRQWCSPAPGLPYRFGGVAAAWRWGAAIERMVIDWAMVLVASLGLRGVCGLDFIVDAAGRPWALEINPRPTASLELYDRAAPGVVALHVAAVTGGVLPAWQPAAGSAALAVVYARRTLQTPAEPPAAARDWPGKATVAAGEPVCTWHAWAADAPSALRRVCQGASLWRRQQELQTGGLAADAVPYKNTRARRRAAARPGASVPSRST